MFLRCFAILCAIVAIAAADEEYIHTTRRQIRRAPCGQRCRFSFCRGRQVNRFLAPNKVSTPLICRNNQDIAAILEIGENLVVPEGEEPIRISQWRPEGLTKPFKKKFFKPLPIPGQENYGLARSVSRGNQNDFTDNRCFIIPIQKYEFVRSNGKIRIVETSDPERDCLAFEAKTPKILIEVQWESGDDFDLSVVEPDGTRLDNSNDRSSCGVFGGDSGIDACGLRAEGTERIWYSSGCSDFQEGRYKAILRHASNCGDGPTDWEMRLVVDGRVVKRKRGTSDVDGGARVGVLRFRL